MTSLPSRLSRNLPVQTTATVTVSAALKSSARLGRDVSYLLCFAVSSTNCDGPSFAVRRDTKREEIKMLTPICLRLPRH